MKKSMRIVLGFVLCLASVLLFPQGAQATDGTWTNLAGVNWSTAGAWLGGSIADSVGATAYITADIIANITITLDSARTLGTMNIGDPSGSHKFTVNHASNTLTFDNSTGGAALNQSSASAGDTISCPVALNDNLTINNASVSNLTLNGAISGAYKLTKTGAGSLTLTRTNTFSSLDIKEGTVINTLAVNSAGVSALGSGTITLGDATGTASATLLFNGASLVTNANPLIIQANANAGTLSITPNTNKTVLFTGPVTMDNALTIDTVNGTGKINLSGAITGAGALTKIGTNSASMLTLAGNNSGFSGAINLSNGTLVVSNNNALGTGRLTIGAGTTLNAQGADVVNAGNNAQSWPANFTFTGTSSLDLGAGAVTLNDNVAISANAKILTVGGSIGDGAGSFGLNKAGNGQLKLSGNNTYEGGTTVVGGRLILTSDSSLGAVPASPAVNLSVTSQWSTVYAYEDMTLNANRKINFPHRIVVAVKSGKTLTIAGEIQGIGFTLGNWSAGSDNGSNSVDGTICQGDLVLSPGNTYAITNGAIHAGAQVTNGTVVNYGRLSISADSCLGIPPDDFYDKAVILSGGTGGADLTYDSILRATDTFTLNANRGVMVYKPNCAIEVDATKTFTIPGAIGTEPGRDGALNKIGSGTLVMGGINTYTGDTTVAVGTLLMNGSLSADPAPVVVNGGALGGTGTINRPVTVSGGTLAPGVSAGTLTVNGTVTLNAGSTLSVDAGASSDLLDLTSGGTLELVSSPALSVVDTAPITVGTVITIVTNATAVNGQFNSLTNGATLDTVNNRYKINYGATSVSLEVMEKPSYLTAGSTNTLVGVVGGNYTFNIGIVSGAVCHVVASTNLLDPNGWVSISGPLVSINGNVVFADTNTATFPARMYRVISP